MKFKLKSVEEHEPTNDVYNDIEMTVMDEPNEESESTSTVEDMNITNAQNKLSESLIIWKRLLAWIIIVMMIQI